MELTASQLIKLYMQTQIIIGYIYYAPTPEARLLDALNGLSDTGPMKRGRFLELTEVTIQYNNGREEKLPATYINKATIHLSGTLDNADVWRGIGAQAGPKFYPFVEKSPVPVRLETQSYIVTGNMYRVSYQKVWNVLEDTSIFLPVTHAQVYTIAIGTQEKVPFIAVNKEHILALQEEEKGSGQKAIESTSRKSTRRSS
ncbi:MAG TPA: hypothetical protein VGA85_03135 [Dehalococcoidales bacterium]